MRPACYLVPILAIFTLEAQAMTLHAPKNGVIELTFHSTGEYADPYNQVDLDVDFAAPDGSSFRVPGFWNGGHVWKVRFSGEKVGECTFKTVCSDAGDSGLHEQTGTITVYEGTATNDLQRHGRIRVSENKRHFVHADGTPFLWVGDTWWMGLTTRLAWPQGFKTLAMDRVAKGFSVIQIIAGPLPDMDAWDPRGKNEAGYPFEADFARINTAYHDHADLKIGGLVEAGLVPCIVGMWGYYLPQIGVDKIKRYWRYLVARYGAYPVVWCVAGEGTMAYYLSKTPKEDSETQKQGWTEVMRSVRETDGYHNLIGIHPTRYGREMVEDDSLMDFEMLQTGHGDMESLATIQESLVHSLAKEPRMPVVNSEVNYEGILGRSWQNVQRWCYWLSMLNGAAGHTYGANGIWQMSTVEQPYGLSPHGRSWGNTPWTEAYQLPGSRQVGLGAKLLRRYPWWEMEVHPEWVDPAGPDAVWRFAGMGIPGKLRIFFVGHVWDPPTVLALEPGVAYRAFYFDPTNGNEIDLGEAKGDAEGKWRPIHPPESHDWVLVMEVQ
ncbi:MAG: hypothetical protein GHCLOJNM_01973 [bacterium]|nr:hypothetical protein [bacterium]